MPVLARACSYTARSPHRLLATLSPSSALLSRRAGADVRIKLEGVIRQQIALHADFQAAQATVSSSAAADDDAARAARVRPPAGLRRRGG